MFSIFDRYVARNVLAAMFITEFTLLVLDFALAYLAELNHLQGDYGTLQAFFYQCMRLPWRTYEYAPLAVLLGGLLGIGSMASSNELTAMRAAGTSIFRLTISILKPLLIVIVLVMALGQWIAPVTEQYAQVYQVEKMQQGRNASVIHGTWQIDGNTFYRIGAVQSDNSLVGVARYEYQGKNLVSASYADFARWNPETHDWTLQNIHGTRFTDDDHTQSFQLPSRRWETHFDPAFLKLVTQDVDTQPITSLWEYAHYQDRQGINSNSTWLAFWQKVLQPFAFIGLMLIAASFVFGPLRSKAAGTRIFMGIVVGLCFKYLQDLLSPASLIFGFSPLWAVLAPIILCYIAGLYLLRRGG